MSSDDHAAFFEQRCPVCRKPMQVVRLESGVPGLPPGDHARSDLDQALRRASRTRSGADDLPNAIRDGITRGQLSGSRLRKEESRQPNLDADILPEPAHSVEITKDLAGNRKFLGDWNLKLEITPEEVVSAERQVRLWYDNRRAGHRESAACRNLLATPRLLNADSKEK